MRVRRAGLRTLVVGFMVVAVGLMSAGVANASVQRVDRFKITEPEFDVGDGNWNAFTGHPVDNARLDWEWDGVNWQPRLIGRLFINNARDECARVQLRVEYQNGVVVTYTDGFSDYCAPNGGLWATEVNFAPVSSPWIQEVRVVLQSAPFNGAGFSTQGSTVDYVVP